MNMRQITFIPILILLLAGALTAENLQIISPNGGEFLSKKESVHVRWNSAGLSGKVVITLYKKGMIDLIISNGAPNTGKFTWRIPPRTIPNNNYRIRIRSINNLAVNDFSDKDFSIVP